MPHARNVREIVSEFEIQNDLKLKKIENFSCFTSIINCDGYTGSAKHNHVGKRQSFTKTFGDH